MTEWLLLGLVVLLIGANGLFVAAEFALVTADRATVERLAREGDRRAGSLLAALRRLSTQLSGAQLGITVTSLVVGFVAEPSLAAILSGPLGLLGLSPGATSAAAFTVAFLLATTAQMVFGELVPKNWAIAEPLRMGRAVAGFQRGFTWAATPVLAVLNGAANAIVRSFGIEPAEELASARSPAELASLTARSARQGTLEPSTADLLKRSIEFGDRRAADVMTPRPRVRFVEAGRPAADVLALSSATGHARFPVTGKGVDDVVGQVHFRDVLALTRQERTRRTAGEICQPLPAVPSSVELDPLLDVLRRSGPQMALVVDEYGGTAGIVTLEDLVEEIVGEIDDEQDRPSGRVLEVPGGGWSVSGLLRPDEAADLTGLRLPEAEDSDTLGGLLTERVGRLARVGDHADLEARDLEDLDEDGVPTPVRVRLRVTRLDGHRVDRMLLSRLARGPLAGDQDRGGEAGDDGVLRAEDERRVSGSNSDTPGGDEEPVTAVDDDPPSRSAPGDDESPRRGAPGDDESPRRGAPGDDDGDQGASRG